MLSLRDMTVAYMPWWPLPVSNHEPAMMQVRNEQGGGGQGHVCQLFAILDAHRIIAMEPDNFAILVTRWSLR